MTEKLTDTLLDRLLEALNQVRNEALAAEGRRVADLVKIERHHRPRARNLIHYLAVRNRDIRPLQQDLLSVGLSSLGMIEPHTDASLDNVIHFPERLRGIAPSIVGDEPVKARGRPHRPEGRGTRNLRRAASGPVYGGLPSRDKSFVLTLSIAHPRP